MILSAQFAARANPPGRLALEAIVAAIFEIVYHEARAGRTAQLSGMIGHMVFLFLTPFLGTEETNKFIDEQFGGAREPGESIARA